MVRGRAFKRYQNARGERHGHSVWTQATSVSDSGADLHLQIACESSREDTEGTGRWLTAAFHPGVTY